MSVKNLFVAASGAFLALSPPLIAQSIMVKDAYVRRSTPSSPRGAQITAVI